MCVNRFRQPDRIGRDAASAGAAVRRANKNNKQNCNAARHDPMIILQEIPKKETADGN